MFKITLYFYSICWHKSLYYNQSIYLLNLISKTRYFFILFLIIKIILFLLEVYFNHNG